MLITIRNGQADRVPAAPDISNMVPCRLTGKPFWNIYYHNDPPLWRAYLDAARHFGIDPWFVYGEMRFQYEERRTEQVGIEKHEDYWLVHYRHHTRAGDRFSTTRFNQYSPPVRVSFPVRDLSTDLDWLSAWYDEAPVGLDTTVLEEQRAALGDDGAFGIAIDYPGFQNWIDWADGGLQSLSYWLYDHPDLMESWRETMHRKMVYLTERILAQKPDYLMINGSGTITLQSPAIARKLSLPTVQVITRMAKEAGIPSMLHSCGKERAWVKMCAEETDLNCINPLEIAPMGDCDLKAIKQAYGSRLALMGNLHTTDVMLLGTPQQVLDASRQAIEDAGAGGGFILSTGDQCGRDTPDANLFAVVEAAERYGCYD